MKSLKCLIVLFLSILSFNVFAEDYTIVDRNAKNFEPKNQPVLIKRKFIKKGEPDVLVMTETFGKVYIESNFDMDDSIQKMEPSEHRDSGIGIGYELAKEILFEIYGIADTDFQPTTMRFAPIALAPEGYIFLIDVTFTRDGKVYKARVGRLNAQPDSDDNQYSFMFVYPRA